MRGSFQACGESALQSFNLAVVERRRQAVKADQAHYAGNLQHLEAVNERNTHEYVTWEKRQLHAVVAILPSVRSFVQGEKDFDLLPHKLRGDRFLVARSGASRVPARLAIGRAQVPRLRASLQSGRWVNHK